MFAGVVVTKKWKRHAPADARHRGLYSLAPLSHGRQQPLGQIQGAKDVGLELIFHCIQIRGFNGRDQAVARVVNHHIWRALGQYLLGAALNAVRVIQIQRDPAIVAFALSFAAGSNDLPAVFGKNLTGGLADTGATAGN